MTALLAGSARRSELDVVGLGETSLDVVCEVAQLADLPEKAALSDEASARLAALLAGEPGGALVLGPEVRVALDGATVLPGGQVATCMLGCARLGLRAGLVSSVGDDAAAALALAPLRTAGVELSAVRRVAKAQTRSALVLVERRGGDRAVLYRRDPRLALEPAALSRAEIARARVLLVDATDPEASLWAAKVAHEAGAAVVIDADRLWPRVAELLALTDFPVVSRGLAEEISGTGSIRKGVEELRRMGARMAVATLGADGAIACDGEGLLESPAFPVAVRDTTGAGDAFHAGFIWALTQGHERASVLRVANAVAGMNCTASGAQGGLPDRSGLARFLREHEGR